MRLEGRGRVKYSENAFMKGSDIVHSHNQLKMGRAIRTCLSVFENSRNAVE